MEYQPELNGKYTPFFILQGCQYFIQAGESSLPYGEFFLVLKLNSYLHSPLFHLALGYYLALAN